MGTLILQPDAAAGVDAYASNGANANLNFGGVGVLPIGTVFVNGQSIFNRGLLRFTLTDLPAGAVIRRASLTLKHTGTGNIPEPCEFRVYLLIRIWIEDQVTWLAFALGQNWTTPGGDFRTDHEDALTIANASTDLVFDELASHAIAAVASQAGHLNLIIIGPEIAGSSRYLAVHSSDAETAENHPRLVVDYTLGPVSLQIGDSAKWHVKIADVGDGRKTIMGYNIYDFGSVVPVTAEFTDESGPIDPDAVHLSALASDGEEVSYDALIVRESLGKYYAELHVDQTGAWQYRWWSTGVGETASRGVFQVKSKGASPTGN